MLDAFAGDLRHAIRLLLKNPGFSLVAIATLAVGIGSTTAIFSVTDHVLLRPLAYRDAARLHVVYEVIPKYAHIAPMMPVNAMHFEQWRRSLASPDGLALVNGHRATMTGSGEPERIATARVTPALFGMLGTKPLLGRLLRPDEDAPGRGNVVVIDHALWTRRFGASPDAIGRKIVLDGTPYEIVGVLPEEFRFPRLSALHAMTVDEDRPEVWRPFAVTPDELHPLGDFNYACIVSLRPGVSLAEASAELNAVQARIADTFPEKLELRAAMIPLQAQITGRAQTGLQLLLAAVAVVLLVGCVNIANLLLARVTGRRREIAIRAALGASASRLARQVFAETLVLAVVGGALGLAVASIAVDAIRQAAPLDLPRLDEVRVDGRVLLFMVALTAGASLLSGLLPAWRFGRTDPQDAMRSTTKGAGGSRQQTRVRTTLVAVEVALSALCLVIGGLLLHSYVRLLGVEAGFDRQQVLAAELQLPGSRYGELPASAAYIRAMLHRVGALPGVISAGSVSQLPLTGEGGNNLVAPEGFTGQVSDRPIVDIRQVSASYFKTMGIPLRAGRIFDEADGDRGVVLLSEVTAARLWPGQIAVGRRLSIGTGRENDLTVVGIVGDVRGAGLDRPPSLTLYRPYWQQAAYRGPSLVVRTAGDPLALAGPVREVLRALDPEVPVPAMRTMQDLMEESVGQRRFQMRLLLLFGLSALLLASLGIYGVVAYSVAQRTGEIGIRLALGAGPARIRLLVLAQSLRPVAAGLVAGLAASVAAARLVGNLLYGVSTADPLTLASVATVLLFVSAAASLGPAVRATRVDPVVALREE